MVPHESPQLLHNESVPKHGVVEDAPPRPGSLHEMLLEELAAVVAETAGPDATDARLDEVASGVEAVLADVVPELVPRIARSVAEAVLERSAEGLVADREARAAFRSALRAMWGEALDGLQLVIALFYEFGRDALVDAGRAGRLEDDERLGALFHLHARSSRTANEVLVLLEAGLADGAVARCRTLHELAVVANVLSAHGADLAERYARHEAVRTLEAMEEHEAHREMLGWEPIPEAEMRAARAHVDALLATYGRRFRHQYGWADGVVAPARPGDKVGLHDLERAAGLAHFRLFGSLASASVHAGAQGLRSRGEPLAMREFAPGPFLYAAGSTSGLDDPGQHAALWLGHVACALLPHLTTLDAQVQVAAIGELAARCRAAFVAAGEAVEERTRQQLAVEARGRAGGSEDGCGGGPTGGAPNTGVAGGGIADA